VPGGVRRTEETGDRLHGPTLVSAAHRSQFPHHPADRAPDAPSTATLPAITQNDGEHHDRSTDTPRQHPNPPAPSRPRQDRGTRQDSRTGQEGCTGQAHRTGRQRHCSEWAAGHGDEQDRTIHFDVGPLEIDIPRTLGYYGGISAAVVFGVLEPPIAVFIAALPVIKMLGTRVAPPPLRFFAQVLQGAGKPVGSDGQGTIRLNDPDRARHDIDHITSGSTPSKNPAEAHRRRRRMTVVWRVLGAVLVLIVAQDVFVTVLFPASGRGIIRKPLSSTIWRIFRAQGLVAA